MEPAGVNGRVHRPVQHLTASRRIEDVRLENGGMVAVVHAGIIAIIRLPVVSHQADADRANIGIGVRVRVRLHVLPDQPGTGIPA